MAAYYYEHADDPRRLIDGDLWTAAQEEIAVICDGLEVAPPRVLWWFGRSQRQILESTPTEATIVERELSPACLTGWYEGGHAVNLVVPQTRHPERRAAAAARHFLAHWYECRHLGEAPTLYSADHRICSARAMAWGERRPEEVELAVLASQRILDSDEAAMVDIWRHRFDESALGIAVTIAAHRTLARMSIRELSQRTGVASEDIDRYESGLINLDSTKQLCDIWVLFSTLYGLTLADPNS